jgi:hypothetical protein
MKNKMAAISLSPVQMLSNSTHILYFSFHFMEKNASAASKEKKAPGLIHLLRKERKESFVTRLAHRVNPSSCCSPLSRGSSPVRPMENKMAVSLYLSLSLSL